MVTAQQCCLAYNEFRHNNGVGRTVLVEQDRRTWEALAIKLNQYNMTPTPAIRSFFAGMSYSDILGTSPKHLVQSFQRIVDHYGTIDLVKPVTHYIARYELQQRHIQDWSKRWGRDLADVVSDPYTPLDSWFRVLYLCTNHLPVIPEYHSEALRCYGACSGLQKFITGVAHGRYSLDTHLFGAVDPSLRDRVPATAT
mgnify:CR=1 FL=1